MIRRLSCRDISHAYALSDAAGWNQTIEDWNRLLALEPDGCFGIERDGRIVATATILCHDQELAWLGMVLTRADWRRRGFARQLVNAALAYADGRGIRAVKLDATDQGRPLYLDAGFEDEQPVERWFREHEAIDGVTDTVPIGPPDLQPDERRPRFPVIGMRPRRVETERATNRASHNSRCHGIGRAAKRTDGRSRRNIEPA